MRSLCLISKIKLLSEIVLTLEDLDPVELYGRNNVKLNLLKEAFPEVLITSRGHHLRLVGEKSRLSEPKER